MQAHISLFSRALPWLLSPCVLSHEMDVISLVHVLLGSHVRRAVTAGRPEADAQCHRCRGVPYLILQTASQGGAPPHCGAHSVRSGTNKDNFPGAAVAAPAAEQAPTSTRDPILVLSSAPVLDQPQEIPGSFSSGTGLRLVKNHQTQDNLNEVFWTVQW